MKPTKEWHERATLELLNQIDKLERELEIHDSPIPQTPTRCKCDV